LAVLIFTGRLTLAVTVGCLEVIAKMILYFVHERFWDRIRYGKEETPAFILWFTGLHASGKRELAGRVYGELVKAGLKVERIDSRDVRPLFPETGFSPEEVNLHIKRSGHLAAMLEKNGVIVVASFLSPYRESREFIREVAGNFIEVYMNTTSEDCARRDPKGNYHKARAGEFKYFPGVDVAYEAPANPEITIDVEGTSTEEAARQILGYLKKNILNGKKLAATSGKLQVSPADVSES
jgi:adenylylsulfate kinase